MKTLGIALAVIISFFVLRAECIQYSAKDRAALEQGEQWYRGSEYEARMDDIKREFSHRGHNDGNLKELLPERNALCKEMEEHLKSEGYCAKVSPNSWWVHNGGTGGIETPDPSVRIYH